MEQNNFKIRDKRKKGWFYLDNEYLNGYARIIGIVGTAIYTSLCRHANDKQTCFPSQELIAEELGVSAKTIRRHINKLKEYNIIAVEQKHDNKGRFLNNVYILMDKNVWKKQPIGQNGSTVKTANRYDKLSITVGTNCPNKETNIKKTNNNTKVLATELPVNSFINKFKDINPSYKKMYSNKTQRACLSRLIKEHGKEKIENLLSLLPKTNTMQYAPVITTPYELEEKLAKLLLFIKKRSDEFNKNKITKIQ